MPDIKLSSKLNKATIEALSDWAERMFADQTGEWVAVVTIGHAGRSEVKKTEDDLDYVAPTVTIRIEDAEVVTGAQREAAEGAREEARRARETAGTLLEGAPFE